jgi:hypothetical protein
MDITLLHYTNEDTGKPETIALDPRTVDETDYIDCSIERVETITLIQ